MQQTNTEAERLRLLGLTKSKQCMDMLIKARREKNLTREFINKLSSRHRGLIYFHSLIGKGRHHLRFEELTPHERKLVISSLRDLRDLLNCIPAVLSDSDIDI